jgi:hypothetical protein
VLGKALKAVSGVTGKDLKQLWNQHGDFGDVAFVAKAKSVCSSRNSDVSSPKMNPG